MKGRNAQISRIYMILNILEGSPQGLSATDLTNRLSERMFEVTKRTVYRDLEALRAAGFPLDEKGSDDENATRWTLERRVKVGDFLVLDSRELLALYLAKNTLRGLEETPLHDDLKSLFGKIEARLGRSALDHLGEIREEIHFDVGPSWGAGSNFTAIETIRAACTERQHLRFTYASTNSQSVRSRSVGPHYLYFSRGALYFVGEDSEDRKVKTFAVPRMSEVEMLDMRYEGEVIEPEQLFENAFGVYRGGDAITVRLRFSKVLAPYISERRWHKSQTITKLDDGRVELTLDAALTPELIQWVIGFGSQVQVLEPKALVTTACAEAKAFLRSHQSPVSKSKKGR